MPDTRRSLSSLQTLLADNTSGDISAQDARDVLISAHPEKIVQAGAYASEPSSSQLTGDMYLPTDGFYAERWSGSAWAPWGPIFPMTKPVDGDFAWINQGGATVDATYGGIYLEAPLGSSQNMRIRKKAAPATPYTITAAIAFNFLTVNFHQGGLLFRQSSDGKLSSFAFSSGGTPSLVVQSFASPTSFNGTSFTKALTPSHLIFLRIADDGTNRVYSYSRDGQHFIQAYSEGRTTYLTADEVGFFCEEVTNTHKAGLTLLSWKEA